MIAVAEFRSSPDAFHQALHLDLLRARHHHHPIAKFFSTCLIKKWNVGKKVFIRLAMLFRFAAPVADELADEEFLRACAASPAPGKPSREVRFDSTAHLHKNVIAKFVTNLGEHGLVMVGELARHGVGIEKLRFRQ